MADKYVWMKKVGEEITPVDPSYVKKAKLDGYKECDPPTEGRFVDAGVVTDPSAPVNLDKMKKADLVKFANTQGIEVDVSLPVAKLREAINAELGNSEEEDEE